MGSVGVTTGSLSVLFCDSRQRSSGRPLELAAASSTCRPAGNLARAGWVLGPTWESTSRGGASWEKATGGRLSHRRRNQLKGLALLASQDTGPGVVMPLVRSNGSIFGFLGVCWEYLAVKRRQRCRPHPHSPLPDSQPPKLGKHWKPGIWSRFLIQRSTEDFSEITRGN